MYSDRTGTDKSHPDKTFQIKDPLTTPHEQLRQNLYKVALVRVFVLGLLNIGGRSEMCDVLFCGGSRDV